MIHMFGGFRAAWSDRGMFSTSLIWNANVKGLAPLTCSKACE